MAIGDRIRALREYKKLSQPDLERRSGCARHFISRLENGHSVPTIETIQKIADGLKVPMYQMFYEEQAAAGNVSAPAQDGADMWGTGRRGGLELRRFRRCLARLSERDIEILLVVAEKIAGRKSQE
jgi:transcriptional regulator with XRE-family HTH domain